MLLRAFLILLPVMAAACTQFPDLEDLVTPESEASDYPDIVPIAPLLANSDPTPIRTGQQEADALEARAAGLRARAAGLQGGVVDPQTRDRMQQGVQTE